ncbi:alpha/beta hydrolase [Nocardia sp. 004]|uniref:alpha/beta hydrolase n=1 Tax=Nocardia sp. 004 TaxID=3385978 RepID=UPI0039A1AAD4
MADINLPLPIARTILNPIFRFTLNKRLPFRLQRRLLTMGGPAQLPPAGSIRRPVRLGGRPAERISFADTTDHGAILYLHGGGYAVGSIESHRSLTTRLARDTGYPVYVLDYRLAPEHPFPAALDDAEAAFLELMTSTGYRPEQIAISGDSAGGGLSLALAQRLIARHGHTPAALGLIAPWVDPSRIPDRERDLVISKPWSQACAVAYLGDADPADSGYTPLHGDMRGLPPTYVQVDVSELLYPQCIDLVAALRSAEIPVSFTESKGLWHVAQLQASLTAPAAAVSRELAEFLREALQLTELHELG